MHIVYDARFFPVNDKFDGVGRYSYQLAHALAAYHDHTFTWLISDTRQIEKLPAGKHLLVNHPDDILRELKLPRQLNTLEADVVYSPFYLMGAGRGTRRYKLVLTIHDMIYFTHHTPPQWLPWYQRAVWWLFNLTKWPTKLLLRPADAVATVSETVKTELESWHMSSRPITPVLNAPLTSPQPHTATNHAASNDIVYMGGFTPYKNVELLIDSMAALPECTLHLLSRIPSRRRSELERRAREKAVQSHVVFHDGVSDETYAQLLESARCLVTASRAEGFGLPILEAQIHGVPVACSDIPIFREVAGQSAVFFDPDSASSCADAIRSLADETTSRQLSLLGLKNSQKFSWKHSATAAMQLCEHIATAEQSPGHAKAPDISPRQ